MVFTISGYTRKCKDSLGGLKKVYLFPYVKYSRSQIVLNGNILVTYPNTTIYEFEVETNPSVSQTQSEENGGKYFSISLSLDLPNTLGYDFQKVLNKDYNIIIEDRNGKLRFLGNRNGLECTSLNYDTGSSKNSFSGLKLSFEGKEENEAWFINDLSSAGFIIIGTQPILSSTNILASTNLISSIYTI